MVVFNFIQFQVSRLERVTEFFFISQPKHTCVCCGYSPDHCKSMKITNAKSLLKDHNSAGYILTFCMLCTSSSFCFCFSADFFFKIDFLKRFF